MAIDVVQNFCRKSGGKINDEKTKYMRFAKASVLSDISIFKEVKEIKILGVLMGDDDKKINEIMWEGILGDIERLNWWKLGTLCLKVKALILNALMVSNLVSFKCRMYAIVG